MSSIAELRYGSLDEVAYAVDNQRLSDTQLRSVILNLIEHIERIEKRLAKQEAA